MYESLNKKSADIELYDGSDGVDICDGVCGGDVIIMGGDGAGDKVIVVGSACGSDNDGGYNGNEK
jgi:hypothetical protein